MPNPFPGLRPFEPDEDHLFFGREKEIDELLRRLRSTRFLAVVGTSGSGKSSLVRSGLIPALQSGSMSGATSSWRIAILRPGEDPIGHLAGALNVRGVLGAEGDDSELASTNRVLLEATLRRGTLGLANTVSQARIPRGENVLVLVDQFEELFRYRRSRQFANARSEAIAFVRLLLEAAHQSETPVFIVLTMRSDFIGDCMDFPGLSEAVNNGLYLVGRMSRDALRSAIAGPVAVAGATIEPRLVNRILNDLGDDHDQLPLVQHALMRTWDRWERDGERAAALDIEHYEAIGTFRNALSRHAEEAYQEAAAATEHGAPLTERLFRAITDTFSDERGVRRPTSVQELAPICEATQAEIVRIVDIFRRPGRSFLMPPPSVALSSTSIVDLSHESLMRCWTRLIAWAEAERASAETYVRLSKAAAWFEQRAAGLWRNPELELAEEWKRDNQPTATWARRHDESFDRAMAFLDRSIAARDRFVREQERERRAKLRRVQWAATVLAAFLAVAVSLAYLAWRESVRAESNLALAREAVDESLSSADRDAARVGADAPQMEEFRRELLAKAQRFYAGFMQQAPRSEKSRRDMAYAHFRLGHINRMLHKREEAAREYQDAIGRFEELAQAFPTTAEYRQALANAFNWLGESWRPVAARGAAAEAAYNSALRLQRALVEEEPGNTAYVAELARTHYNQGILRAARPAGSADAESDFREAMKLLQPLADANLAAAQELARICNNLAGVVFDDPSRRTEARDLWERAIDIDERLLRTDPNNREYALELAKFHNNLAILLLEEGDIALADRSSQRALELLDVLARLAPSVAVERADAHTLRGSILQARSRAAAEHEYTHALDLFEALHKDPNLARTADFHQRFGDLLLNVAAFRNLPANASRVDPLTARAVAIYANVVERIAAAGGRDDAQLAVETLSRVLPHLPVASRTRLEALLGPLQQKIDSVHGR